MGKRQRLWPILTLISVVITVIIFSGFIYATNEIISPSHKSPKNIQISPSTTPSVSTKTIRIVGLGDSLTKGYGDSSGLGYAGNVKNIIQSNHKKKKVVLVNFAVNGAKTVDLINQLQTKSGVASTLKTSQYVLVTIGGNDLYKQGQPITATELNQIEQRRQTTLANLKLIFKEITAINPELKIIYVGLYNPFQAVDASGTMASLIQSWNQEVSNLSLQFPQVTVVPTFDLFLNRTTTYLWNDVYHPNMLGYKQMAIRVAQVLEADFK